MSEFPSCDHCGGEAAFDWLGAQLFVRCTGCGASTPTSYNERAIDAWERIVIRCPHINEAIGHPRTVLSVDPMVR